jgi:hypothetical protein
VSIGTTPSNTDVYCDENVLSEGRHSCLVRGWENNTVESDEARDKFG